MATLLVIYFLCILLICQVKSPWFNFPPPTFPGCILFPPVSGVDVSGYVRRTYASTCAQVADITFTFWNELSDVLYEDNRQQLIAVFQPYIQRLVTALCRHCRYSPTQVTTTTKTTTTTTTTTNNNYYYRQFSSVQFSSVQYDSTCSFNSISK